MPIAGLIDPNFYSPSLSLCAAYPTGSRRFLFVSSAIPGSSYIHDCLRLNDIHSHVSIYF